MKGVLKQKRFVGLKIKKTGISYHYEIFKIYLKHTESVKCT